MPPAGADPDADRAGGFASVEAVQEAFARERYVADRPLALMVLLAARLGKPILLEGEAGVGKTELAAVWARALDTPLVRLQCYEGLDASHALYEWNYARQILHLRAAESRPEARVETRDLFAEAFLLERPLLRAIRHEGPRPAILLIDEIDRADEEFEAFLLEVLADHQVTVPEIGTFRARLRPHVVLTSNRTRELHDALKRRCLYLWIDHPDAEREREIVLRRVPGIDEALAARIVAVAQSIRRLDLDKPPGVAETIDWSLALLALAAPRLEPRVLEETAGCLLKTREDLARLHAHGAARVLAEAEAGAPAGAAP